MHFNLHENTPEREKFLLDLVAGRVRELRLVTSPSRDIALKEPDMDRYWGGKLSATIPVELK